MFKYKIEKDSSEEFLCKVDESENHILSIPYVHDNTDYQQFKIDIVAGVELNDANNNPMTSDQITAFLGTLP